jgi:methylmalonyl-CoA/ethylmalonyl-CoA epimerase
MNSPSHIEHIGIAVKNLEKAISFYEDILGLKCYNIETIPEQMVRTAFIMVGGTKIELLESTDPDGPIGRFIERRGEGIHHIAFAVNNIREALAHASDSGVRLIDSIPRKGAEGLDIAFLHPGSTSGVLIEFCKKTSNYEKE